MFTTTLGMTCRAGRSRAQLSATALQGGTHRVLAHRLMTVCAPDNQDLAAQEFLEGAFDEEPELEFPPAAAALVELQPVAEEAELSALVTEEEDVAGESAVATETVTPTTAPEEPELGSSPAAASLQPVAEEGKLSAPVSANEPASANETVTPTTAPSRCAIIAIA